MANKQSPLKAIYDNLEIIQTDTKDWKQTLENRIGKVDPETNSPFKNILNLLEERMGCHSVIVEKEYVDADYLEEYSSYYSKVFRNYSSKARRLHFFKDRVDYDELANLSKKKYLGYSVLRPTESFRTGRTVLLSPYDDGNEHYTLCKAKFDVNLSGNPLQLQGMPFIQQDTNVNVCAQASLWMASLYMHKKYGYPRFTSPEITELATKYIITGPVRTGLTERQMLIALRDMGYCPAIFPHYSVEKTAKIIYSYIESEIPVILTLQLPNNTGHAITIIGHDYDINAATSLDQNSNIRFIKNFYYQDDVTSPYKKLEIGTERHSFLQNVIHVIVPNPKEVVMQIDDVLNHLGELVNVNRLNELVGFFTEKHKFSEEELQGLVLRTYLRGSNDFKNSLPEEMEEFFRIKYRAMRMPRYIWVTEISKKELLSKPLSADRRIIGEIIIDSSADRHVHMESYLAIHLLGRMLIRKPEQPFQLLFSPEEKYYPHFIRRP